MNTSILISLCARGGSKGIPGKNIKEINGLPLIQYSIKTAENFKERFKGNVDIELSTDSEEIKEIAAKSGLKTNYTRPSFLATDQAGKIDVFKDLLKYAEEKNNTTYDYYLDLDISSPLRSVDDLMKSFEIINNDDEATSLFSVSEPHKNPYFNMVEQNDTGYWELSKKPKTNILSRQSAPKVYDMNASFYFIKRRFFENNRSYLFEENCLIYIVPHMCFDLDEKIDFEFMEYLMKNDKLDFKL